MPKMTDIAVVGLGSWGLCLLERVVARARNTDAPIRVHVVEPSSPGGGVYTRDQPDFLVLNNPCGQLSLFAAPSDGEDWPYATGLFDWVTERGYQWFGYECRIGTGGVPIQPADYLPRRVMGEYLTWFYQTLVDNAPANLEVVHHNHRAVDIRSQADNCERVVLDDGTQLDVDHVVLTSGHTFNEESIEDEVRLLRPYPVAYFKDAPPPGETLAICGMGLVAFDLMIAVTVGRGGTFEPDGDRLTYTPSGSEPLIYLWSRTGQPFLAKSATGIDPTGAYQPIVCTPGAFGRLRDSADRRSAQVNFRVDVLPLVFAEMKGRYYHHAAMLKGGPKDALAVHGVLSDAWARGSFDQAISALQRCYGEFRPEDHLIPSADRRFESGEDFQRHLYRQIEDDLDEALHPGGSPIKAALEVTRILRDDLRSVLEFGGLSLHSYLDFQANIRGHINRIEAGPPPIRSAQLLALMDAGVVRVPFGPSPRLSSDGAGRAIIASTRLQRPESAVVDTVVRGHLDMPSLAKSASPLLNHLYRLGRLTQMRYGDTAVGSVAISEDFHPFDAEGRLQENISVLGVLTEGVRYFTHYLPSPQSRLRAVLDAQRCVEGMIA